MEYPLNYDSSSELKSFLEEHGLFMNKRFGQNFLINRGAREKICGLLGMEKGDRVWEIGPGLGAMTWHLLEAGADLTVFEIDRGFIEQLRIFYGNNERFRLVEGDFIKTRVSPESGPLPRFVLGNLPYSSGSVMIADLLKAEELPEVLVFTVQKEVAQRMAASPGTRDYSAFSLICQARCDVSIKGDLKPGSFYPQPDVVSSIAELRVHGRFNPGNSRIFDMLVNDLFLSRRKTIRNNLQKGKLASLLGVDEVLAALEESGIEPGRRGETLSSCEAEELSRLLSEIKH